MIIIHTVKERTWNKQTNEAFYGGRSIRQCGFIHCSDLAAYSNVAPNFKDTKDKLVLVLIDTDKLAAKVKWEDLHGDGVAYPHIYGLLNKDAVVAVLPHLWDENRVWVANEELRGYQ